MYQIDKHIVEKNANFVKQKSYYVPIALTFSQNLCQKKKSEVCIDNITYIL